MAGNAARSLAQQQGRLAESKALKYLQKNGLKLLVRNYHCRHGEIDLIMRDATGIVVVEVRHRKSNRFASAALSVDHHKQSRLTKAAAFFLARHPAYADSTLRFDVIGFDKMQDNECKLQWIQDAFRPG